MSTISSTSARTDAHPPLRARLRPLAWLLGLIAGGIILRRIGQDTGFDLVSLVQGLPYMGRLVGGIFDPDWSVFPTLVRYARETIEMSILGTVLGAALALPISFLGARNLMARNPATRILYFVVRFLMSSVRAMPTLFWGLLFVAAVGIGQFPGVLAITVFSAGLLAKLYSEAIEGIDWGQIEAVTATGANPWQVLLFAIMPQFFPYFVAHTLYSWEVNVHSATILGAVGAGGLGFVALEYINQFAFRKTGMVLLVTLVMTLAIDYGSAYLRSKIL
jgi:phosphonate transport system permease protein